MSAPQHEMILASAGSGKTYALTGRFVRLLAGGARPERIIALTFTRKAAGEFFDEILRKLAGAAADADRAAALAREVGRPSLGREDFLRLLREVIEAMPRLRLGTLDSFFARIARSFPLELGLAGEFEILHEHAARLERRRVLRRMFARAGALDGAQREFIEAFKRATFGREEKRLGAQLDAFLDEHHEVYLAAPEASTWGDPARIWPAGQPWLGARPDATAAVRALRAWLAAAAPADKQRRRWEDFLAAFDAWTPGSNPPRELVYVLEKAFAAWSELKAGATILEFDRRKQELDAPAAAALAEIARAVAGGELARRLEMTRGIFAVLRGYERTYHDVVRRAGRLTFADVQRLLAPGAGAPALTREPGEGRLFIDYRLDAEIDHWLLDEFQDTSFGQWSVLKNLIDEVVQDPEARRTFFCVGDVKQAIYTWREGDPRLFREIHRHYTAAAPGAIVTGHLDESWRSGPAVIAMVNQVFGDRAALEDLFPGPMSAAWNAEWRPHVTAVPQRTGQAAWLLADEEDERRQLVLDLLRELQPLDRGMSCAVLVQTNRAAAELADYLRQEAGMPAVAESDLPVCTDNPLGAAVLALVQAAAHPGDTLAWEHVRMTPFAEALAREGIHDREALTRRILGQIHHGGFEGTVAHWINAVEPSLAADDAFSRARGRQLVDAARRFDGTGGRSVSEFVAFMERHTIREPEGAAVVRVMTLHKAKGLGFDIVLLPDLEGTRLDQARSGLAVHKGGDRSIEWVLDAPPRLFAEQDAVLAAHAREAEAEAGYEALSLLYVGLTRAKRGLYVITGRPGDSTSRNYPRLLAATLANAGAEREVPVGRLRTRGAWAEGDANWHQAVSPAAVAPAPGFPGRVIARVAAMKRFPALRPSAHAGAVFAAGLFSLQRGSATDYGTQVHSLLAQVEWGPAPEIVAGWPTLTEPAAREAAAVLQAPGLRDVWRPPAEAQAEVWRERSFEMIWDESWITGTIDRVIVEQGPDGLPLRATVYDFKTDGVEEAAVDTWVPRYADQLRLYRQAAARLTGLPLAQVRGVLVLTKLLRLVEPAT
jgi:ATP-dependent helicase/nuclease subunit A